MRGQPIFSDEDSDLRDYTWEIDGEGYARRPRRDKLVPAHYIVLVRLYGRKPTKGLEVADHINRIRLDNRRENLRITSYSGNALNRSYSDNARHWTKAGNRFFAHICIANKIYYPGTFDTPEEARAAALKFRESLNHSP